MTAEPGRLAEGQTAFVLGGGSNLGAYEVGMLRALLQAKITPDLVVGTSVGAVNAARRSALVHRHVVHAHGAA
ncbi:MAG: patatin-like phospholipase family protein [Streptosporangiaceae bacterium]